MDGTNKNQKILDSIIKKTKAQKMEWNRITYQDLMNPFLQSVVDCADLNRLDSFKCAYKDGFIYLLCDIMYYLFIQPGPHKALTQLDIPQSKIAQLRNIIRDNIDNIDSFVDSLLDE